MRNSFKNPDKYFAGEQWVLGDQGAANIDRANLAKQLADRYFADFIKQWRNYIKAGSVVKYANIQDAATKLNVLSGNTSTLLALFSLASTNTDVDEPDVKKAFQPVQAVVVPNADRFIGPGNQTYMNALLTLQTSVDKAANAPQLNEAVAAPVLNDASNARVTTKQVAQTFRVDPEGRLDAMVQKLMEDPITSVEALLKRLGPDELNGKGKDVCGQYRRLSQKYPFNPSTSAPPASIAEVNSIFAKPDGAIWKFYTESLQKMLPKQGDRYVAVPSPGMSLTPAFVNFFNQAASVSDMFYAGGTADPHVTYALKPIPSEGIRGIGLKLDGQSWTYAGGDAPPKQFTWQGAGTHGAQATVNLGGPDLTWSGNEGLWATWQFFAEAETWQAAGSGYNLEWVVRTGGKPLTLPSGKALTVKFQLDMGGGPPVFQKGYLSKMVCIADVAK
jgi:type VI secretion system protein ImpL